MGKVDKAAREYREYTLNIIKELISYYSLERISELKDFIYTYNRSSLDKICFKVGEDCDGNRIDVNSDFRSDIAYYIISNYSSVISSELLRDIYVESGKCSEEICGGPEHIAFIAEYLIRQTGSTYIREFSLYLTSSFDFYGACITIDLYDYPVNELISTIKNLKTVCIYEDEHQKYEHAIEFLQRYI